MEKETETTFMMMTINGTIQIGRTTNGIINSIVIYLKVNSQLRKLLSLLEIRIKLALSIASYKQTNYRGV